MEKTLVIVIGNARGGEKTWKTMYKNLLSPYKADLAVCFGHKEDKSESLYKKAKYIWEIPEYEEWADYYVENFGENGIWKRTFEMGIGNGFSGLYGTRGSSAILFVFRHWLLKNKKDTILKYDRIIITRSDFYYYKKHPILTNDHFWIPIGEGYGGITDRHHIFPSSDVDEVFGIIENYINTDLVLEDFHHIQDTLNIEQCYMKYFKRIGYLKKVKEFERVQFTVRTKEDTTRWYTGDGDYLVPGHTDLYLKYGHEFTLCVNPEEIYDEHYDNKNIINE